MAVSGGIHGSGRGGGAAAMYGVGAGAGVGGGRGGGRSAVSSPGGVSLGGFGSNQGPGASHPLSPPLSPMYNSPKGISPRTNILPSFAWGKTMLKHLKRRSPVGSAMTRSQAAAMAAGGLAREDRGRGRGGAGMGTPWGTLSGGLGVEGDGGFVYPAGMVQVRSRCFISKVCRDIRGGGFP